MKTVFLGGCPGSGKTWLAERVARTDPRIRHVVAGKVIRDEQGHTKPAYDRPIHATSGSVVSAQQSLIEGIQRLRSQDSLDLLLDGHFVVPVEQDFQAISADTFRLLLIDAVVLVEAPVTDLVVRLLARDPLPAWWDQTAASIERFRLAEASQARSVATTLKVPFLAISSSASGVLAGICRLFE